MASDDAMMQSNSAGAGRLPAVLAGAALGAGFMYFFDPNRGRRRRALLRDQAISRTHHWADHLSKTARYTRDKAWGTLAEARACVWSEQPPDAVLVDRVRSAMGRATSHPSAVVVDAQDGIVTLRGPILAHEVDRLLTTVASVRGVREVRDELSPHESREDVPALQGGGRRGGRQWDVAQEHWSPTTRLLAAMIGGGLGLCAARRRDAAGAIAGAVGLALLARSVSNLPTRRLVGVGAGRRAIDVHKTIHVDVPVEQAFEFWSNFENFPYVMKNVHEVRDHGSGRSHWVVAGPMGEVEWDAELTAFEPNRRIAWKSVPGSTVQHAGFVRFEPGENGRGAKIEVHLTYNPPGGATGHALARVFGADPKSEMDADLMRMKTFLETGHAPHDAAQRGAAGVASRAG